MTEESAEEGRERYESTQKNDENEYPVCAPQWMQRCNLEWPYRLLQDPKRLFKRYLITNTKFIWHAVIKGR